MQWESKWYEVALTDVTQIKAFGAGDGCNASASRQAFLHCHHSRNSLPIATSFHRPCASIYSRVRKDMSHAMRRRHSLVMQVYQWNSRPHPSRQVSGHDFNTTYPCCIDSITPYCLCSVWICIDFSFSFSIRIHILLEFTDSQIRYSVCSSRLLSHSSCTESYKATQHPLRSKWQTARR